MKPIIEIHRYRDTGGVSALSDGTVYLPADQIRALGNALLELAADIETTPYCDSWFSTRSVDGVEHNEIREIC